MPYTRKPTNNARRQRRDHHVNPPPIHNRWDTNGWDQPQDNSAWLKPLDQSIWDLRELERMTHVDMVYDMVPWWIQGMEAAERGEEHKMMDFLARLDKERDNSDSWGQEAAPRPVKKVENVWAKRGARPWQTKPKTHEAALAPQVDDWGRPIGRAGQEWDDRPEPVDPEWQKTLDECDRVSPWGNSDKTKTDDDALERMKWSGANVDESNQAPPPRSQSPQQDSWQFVDAVARKHPNTGPKKREMYKFFKMPTEDKVRNIEQMIHDLKSR